MGRRTRRAATVVAMMVLVLLVVPAASAFADAGPNASCMGHEASGISPAGSSEELPGGMPELKAFIDETFPGVPPGAIFRVFASLHEGSHEACDEALE